MAKGKFFECKKCGNLVGLIREGKCPVQCCGEPLTELVPNTVDASAEKHVPVISREGTNVVVKVGSAPHPMTEEHLIEWIYLATKQGGQRKALTAGGASEAVFALAAGDEPIAAYAYCNLHGLWMAEA